MTRILITGGAGFIGHRLTQKIRGDGHEVLVVDNLHEQVHGSMPSMWAAGPGITVSDVRDLDAMRAIMGGFEPAIVYHLAAETGTGQSNDEPSRHAATNVLGFATVLEALGRTAKGHVRVVLASSRAVYGEGAWLDGTGDVVYPVPRTIDATGGGNWDPRPRSNDPADGRLRFIPHDASAHWPRPSSVYGATKLAQENLVTAWCDGHDASAVVLRFQNVYGPGQSLQNPYTGVLTLFARLAHEGRVLPLYEDGQIVRDFVYVDDAVDALQAAGRSDVSCVYPIDIGSGHGATLEDVARLLVEISGGGRLRVTGDFRPGDVRCAYANIDAAKEILGWSPATCLQSGLESLVRSLAEIE